MVSSTLLDAAEHLLLEIKLQAQDLLRARPNETQAPSLALADNEWTAALEVSPLLPSYQAKLLTRFSADFYPRRRAQRASGVGVGSDAGALSREYGDGEVKSRSSRLWVRPSSLVPSKM